MKKTVFILTLLLFCFLTSCKSTNMSETLQISDCELHSEYTTVYYGKSEQIEIGNHSFLSVCLSPETKFNENSSLLYSLLVYDANDVQHRTRRFQCSYIRWRKTARRSRLRQTSACPKTTQKVIQFVKLFLMVMSFLKSSTRMKILLLVILKSL